MSQTVSECNAEIARLISEKADLSRIAGAHERRAVAERREEEAELLRELEALVEAARACRGKRLSPLAVRRIVERLYGAEALQAAQPSPYRPQPKGRVERIEASEMLSQTRQVQHAVLQASLLNHRGRKA